jgi:VWFA-related protein
VHGKRTKRSNTPTLVLLITCVALSLTNAQGQTTSPSSAATPVFRANTRLVQVDVVVTDKTGNPITGLNKSDFTVLQDGKPQTVTAFEAHVPWTAGADELRTAAPEPELPPNTYTNRQPTGGGQTWNIVLYDHVNTPISDQQYAREQLLTVVKSLPTSSPAALVLLNNQNLEMLQDFTVDRDALLQKTERLHPAQSLLLTSQLQNERAMGDMAQVDKFGHLRSAYAQTEALRLRARTDTTVVAFKALARALAGYPGRKNVIWLSGSFPIQIGPKLSARSDPWRDSRSFLTSIEEAGALLADFRVAVYPVDVRGLQRTGIDITLSPAESGLYLGSGDYNNGSVDATANLLRQEAENLYDERSTMTEIADETGGHAFVGTNDLAAAMKRAFVDGATFYTLAYTPDKNDNQTTYHHIEVKLNREGVKLSYRRGYYYVVPKSSSGAAAQSLRDLLDVSMLPATSISFRVTLKPVRHSVEIEYLVSPNHVTFMDSRDNGKRVVLDCIAVAFDQNGRKVTQSSDTLEGKIPAEGYESVLSKGIPAHQLLSLKPGTYALRVGIIDRASQQVGTMSIPFVME